jgi:ribosomal protein S18 acetylase RimI-like enzyme
VLQRASGLSTTALEAIAELERQVVEADGGRLKLEWGTLRTRSGGDVEDLLWWEGDLLLGFAGLYSFGPSMELSGVVAPAARRQGIASALLEAGLELGRHRGHEQALLVVPRPSAGGRELALRHRGVLDHSEHALVLLTEPSEGSSDPRIGLRRAGPDDAVELGRLLEVGFGHPAPDLATLLGSDRDPTLLVVLDDQPVGTIRYTRDGDHAGISGFVVDPAQQGRGIGRQVLRRVCRDLRHSGARQIGLEVEVDNDRALGLYTSVGFTQATTEDYYALPVS